MRRLFAIAGLLTIAGIVVGMFVAARQDDARTMELTSWIPYWDQERALQSFRDHAELFRTVSLFWYYLDANGVIQPYAAAGDSRALVAEVHQSGVQVFALVANMPDFEEGGDWDAARVQRVIGTAAARAAHVRDLVALATEGGFDGIDIDYEALRADQCDDFTTFIRELADALHTQGKLLGVGLHPKTSEGNPAEDNGSHAQDWALLARLADRLYLMSFGEHYAGGEPGPIASLPWVERVVSYAVDDLGVPPDKLVLEWPFYAVEWVVSPDGGIQSTQDELTLRDAEALRVAEGATVLWDDASQSPSFRFVRDGAQHVVWFEDTRSLQAKLDLAQRYGIHHIAYWRFGGEAPALWDVLVAWTGV